MTDTVETTEFSICLLADDATAGGIQELRDTLPPSPYRDDTPHITLLRGISASAILEDDQLLGDVDAKLHLCERLPLTATVTEIANKSNQFYTATGLLLLEASPELVDLRRNAATQLQTAGYSIEVQELAQYMPHVTVRLGIPLEVNELQHAQRLFPVGHEISFGSWALFRLVKEGDRRQMREIKRSK